MIQMSIAEWSTLTIDQRKEWLRSQSPKSLSELLIIISDMIRSDDVSNDINMLIDPSPEIIIARDHTIQTLKDVQYDIVAELHERQVLVERVA